jgi:hypothetical protein
MSIFRITFVSLSLLFYIEGQADVAIDTFLADNCIKCHGPEKQKGDLRLDTLPPLPGEPRRWTEIYTAISSGEMPPEDEARPDTAAAARALELIASAIPKPVSLRRMNRTEYEHTVQDLLGIETPLAELLPEDGSVQGFDNVSDGLSISSILMERYLEAANTAFDAVIRRFPPLPAETRRAVLMESKDNIASVKENKGGVVEVENSLVKFTPGWPEARIDDSHPIEDGTYRCRVAVWPHDPGGRTLTVAAFVGPLFGPGKRRFMGLYDVTGTPKDPRIIEFTTFMEENETIHILPWVYPEHVTWRDKHESRPGVGISSAETHGPLDQSFPSLAQQQLFGTAESIAMEPGDSIWMRHRKGVKSHNVVSSDPHADAERIIRNFAPRAFRRPVEKEVVDPFVSLTLARLDAGRTFEQAVRAGVCAILCAPQFLLLNSDPVVDDLTVASRLSYFLWSTLPDAELAASKLSDPKIRHAQVERMLADKRSQRFVQNFTGQWLNLREINFTTPDKTLYPEFDEMLEKSMTEESLRFFRHLLDNDLSITNFIDSDFTFLNERLANHYGIPGVQGHENVRLVTLPDDSIRGGILTHASIHKVTANGASTSPILRGVWMLENILGQPTPPPPPGIPAVEPDIRGAVSIKDQIAKHSSDNSCARCHDSIDPPGFALEIFDPIGKERNRYRSLGEGDKAPDKKVAYKLGLPVEPANDAFLKFRQDLKSSPAPFHRAFATKLLVYATGRPFTPFDQNAIDPILKHDGLRSMIHTITDTELFLTKP